MLLPTITVVAFALLTLLALIGLFNSKKVIKSMGHYLLELAIFELKLAITLVASIWSMISTIWIGAILALPRFDPIANAFDDQVWAVLLPILTTWGWLSFPDYFFQAGKESRLIKSKKFRMMTWMILGSLLVTKFRYSAAIQYQLFLLVSLVLLDAYVIALLVHT